MSAAEEMLISHIKAIKLPEAVREFKFHPVRKWRLDIAWPDHKIAVEVQGGMWLAGKGGHTSGTGRTRDMEKNNHALLLGWAVYEFSPAMIKSGEAICMIETVLRGKL